MKGTSVINYNTEKIVAPLAVIAGMLAGGFIGIVSGLWVCGLLMAAGVAIFAWVLMQIARTEPLPTKHSLDTSALDVLHGPESSDQPWPIDPSTTGIRSIDKTQRRFM